MQPTDARRPGAGIDSQPRNDTETDDTFEHRWATVGWWGLRVSALLLWVGVGSYAWFRSMQPVAYTIAVVGGTLGITLVAGVFGRTEQPSQRASRGRQSRTSRLVTGSLLVAVVGGTIAVARSAEQVGAGQPTPSTLTVAAAVLLCGSLLVVAARQSIPLAGLAVVAVTVFWTTAPGISLIETAVFGSHGIYGPLTQAAVTWIAPACLLVGCWRAAGTPQRLVELWTVRADGWSTDVRWRGVGRLIAGGGSAILLAGWQTGAVRSLSTVGLAAVPVGLVAVALLHGLTSESTATVADGWPPTADAQLVNWLLPVLLVGGPLGLMAVVGVGYRLPVGTTLVAGCLCCLGLYIVRPVVDPAAPDSAGLRAGLGTILDGSLSGVGLLARVVLPLAVVSGSVSLLEAAGGTIWLLGGVGLLAGGHPVALVGVVACCCVVLGALLPLVGGYAVGALLGVPLLQLLGSVPELTAHLTVLSGVVTGWLLVARRVRTTATMSSRLDG